MRWQVFKLYFQILFEERKQSLIYLFLHGICELAYNICLIYMPALLLQWILKDVSVTVILIFFFIFAFSVLFKRILLSRLSIEQEVQDQILIMKITDKMNQVPYYYLEEETIRKKKENCIFAIQNYGAAYDLYAKCIEILSSFITLLAVLGVMLKYDSLYILLILFLSLVSVLINMKFAASKMKLSQKTIELNYSFGYYQELATQKKYQINHRLYHYADFINRDFQKLNAATTKHFSRIRETEANYGSIFLILSYLQKMISYIFPIIYLFFRKIAVDEFTLLINCGIHTANHINTITHSFQELIQALDYLAPIAELMHLPEMNSTSSTQKMEAFETLTFKNVTFKYPHTDTLILNHVNFEIHKNDSVALLGFNGAGKTTIVKLLLKLYVPDSGEILYNGRNIQEYGEDYIKKISVVFQDCKVFPISLQENIGAADNHMESIIQSCSLIGFDQVMQRKNIDFDQLCNAEVYEDGIEFSGGEKQLLAITRAFNRKGEFMILDEPSSALDPIMRSNILSKFKQLCQQHTTLLITHDLHLANQCKRILEIKDGSVIEHEKAEEVIPAA